MPVSTMSQRCWANKPLQEGNFDDNWDTMESSVPIIVKSFQEHPECYLLCVQKSTT